MKDVSKWMLAALLALFSATNAFAQMTQHTGTSRDARSTKAGAIVFVHGLFGEGRTTFLSSPQEGHPEGVLWPDLMLRDGRTFDSGRSFSDYDMYFLDYHTSLGSRLNVNDLTKHVKLMFRTEKMDAYSNIIFIAHSLGGILTKTLYQSLKEEEPGLAERIKGILLIAVPSQGTGAKEELSDIFKKMLEKFLSERAAAKVKHRFDQGLERLSRNLSGALPDLTPLNSYLNTVEAAWDKNFQNRKSLPQSANDRSAHRIPYVQCAYEKEKTYGIELVSGVYARTSCDPDVMPFSEDHIAIVKPGSVRSLVHIWVRDAIERIDLRHGGDTVQATTTTPQSATAIPAKQAQPAAPAKAAAPVTPAAQPPPIDKSAAIECDRRAANPRDKRRTTKKGASLRNKRAAREAANACRRASLVEPNQPRFDYQFARTQFALGFYVTTATRLRRADAAGYPAAREALAILGPYLRGRTFSPIPAAETARKRLLADLERTGFMNDDVHRKLSARAPRVVVPVKAKPVPPPQQTPEEKQLEAQRKLEALSDEIASELARAGCLTSGQGKSFVIRSSGSVNLAPHVRDALTRLREARSRPDVFVTVPQQETLNFVRQAGARPCG